MGTYKSLIFSVFFAALSGYFAPPFAFAEQKTMIVAVVNEGAISQVDVQDRMRLLLVSSGLPNTQEMQAKVLPQVLDSLIEEYIKIQEATRNDIEVTAEEVQAGLREIADQNKFTPEEFEQIMRQQGVPKQTLLHQIEAQIAWSKVIQLVLRPKVDVSRNDVEAQMERLKKNVGKTEFFVSEIYLPTEDPKNESEVRQLANKLVQEIKSQKAPFHAVASQFSKSAGAKNGGLIGWVQEQQLDTALGEALATLEEGAVSAPIKTQVGYHILQLQKKRIIAAENLPSKDELANQIGFSRLDKLQQRYLFDLKSSAFIDKRV